MSSTHAPMLKKRGREGNYCDNRHCVSGIDSEMSYFDKGSQRARERREWMKDQADDV